jgi:hypothetical protein
MVDAHVAFAGEAHGEGLPVGVDGGDEADGAGADVGIARSSCRDEGVAGLGEGDDLVAELELSSGHAQRGPAQRAVLVESEAGDPVERLRVALAFGHHPRLGRAAGRCRCRSAPFGVPVVHDGGQQLLAGVEKADSPVRDQAVQGVQDVGSIWRSERGQRVADLGQVRAALPLVRGQRGRVRCQADQVGEPAAGADRADLGGVADQDDGRAGAGGVAQQPFGVPGGYLGRLVDDERLLSVFPVEQGGCPARHRR